jgi:predicted nucleotidyltransferase
MPLACTLKPEKENPMTDLSNSGLSRPNLPRPHLSGQDSSQPPLVDQRDIDYWRQQSVSQLEQQQQAMDQAWQDVRQMAQCLRQTFGAKRIIVFGSLVRGGFNQDSDIDLAVDHLPPARYFEAVARVNDFSARWVDLKPLEALTPYFRDRVLATGVDIDESR